jgi:hypothetical protein
MNGIRQLRLNDQSQIKTRTRDFIGKKINVVLHDKMVMFGELKEVKPGSLVILNMRLKKMEFTFDEISEIYFDVIV